MHLSYTIRALICVDIGFSNSSILTKSQNDKNKVLQENLGVAPVTAVYYFTATRICSRQVGSVN
jgi:hypothetical protein